MAEPEEEFVYRTHRPSEPLDPAIRRMVLGAGGVSVLVIVVALLWSGVRATGFGPPPVILPPDTPLRVVPADPGGLTVPEADQQIMSGDDSGPAPDGLAAAPAAPNLAQLDQAAGVNQPPPAPAPVAAAAPAPAPTGPAVVQLAAAADEPGALSVWNGLKAKYPDLFSGKDPEIVPAVVNGQSIWRLRLGGFASDADATAFCGQVTAKGAACTVAGF